MRDDRDGTPFAQGSSMRSLAYLSALLLAACGGSLVDEPTKKDGSGNATVSSSSSSSGSSTTSTTTGPDTIVGGLYALTELADTTTYQRFDMNLQVMPPPDTTAFCASATATVGTCCYFAPVRVPTQLPGPASTTVATESSAGTVTFSDATSNGNIDTFPYVHGEYANAPGNYTTPVWQPGDLLRVAASGGAQVGAFTISAPALIPPVVQAPATIPRSQDALISWQPDPNADTFAFSVLDGGGAEVACSASDAAGTLTIDATLLALMPVSTRAQAVGQRSTTTRYVQTSTGRITFTTRGWTSFDVALP